MKPSMHDETPEFYRKIYKDKPKTYYRTVLRSSFKYILALNWAIYQQAKLNTETYYAYVYVQDLPFENAKYGDRYRFVNYLTAYVTKDGADSTLICKKIIPKESQKGTVIRLIVLPGCEN
jgi:hypothetical protein